MPINSNHLFEELDGIKCSIVEKNVNKQRSAFLRELLEYNGFTVIVVPSPPSKAKGPATPAIAATDDSASQMVSDPTATQEETYSVGVTNVLFNPTNAIFGRLLKTPNGHIVTLKYWEQSEEEAHDEIPYYENKV